MHKHEGSQEVPDQRPIPPEIAAKIKELEKDLAEAHSLDELLNMEKKVEIPPAPPQEQNKEAAERELRYLIFKRKCAVYARALFKELLEQDQLDPKITADELPNFLDALIAKYQKEMEQKEKL